ncbi:hypothetical protein GCM10027174_04280 [Salinifilum aidingensis]
MNSHRSKVTHLPPYRAVLVVDVKSFSGQRGRDHGAITDQIPVVLRSALQRCGWEELWERLSFHGSTGDGYFLGMDPVYLPVLLNPFLSALQDELEMNNRAPAAPLRMRVSVTVGPMADSGNNDIADGSGERRIEAHRMLDSEPVRDLLERSSGTTCVAAIVSQRVYEDAVLEGYSAEDPELYVPVDVTVKTYQGTAYLRVPKPSGSLLTEGIFASPQPESGGQPAASSPGPRHATDGGTDAVDSAGSSGRNDNRFRFNNVGSIDGAAFGDNSTVNNSDQR